MRQTNQKNFGVFVIILVSVLNISCKENLPSEFSSTKQITFDSQKNNDTIIAKTGIYLLNPDQKEIDSLKKTIGEDDFYIVADDSNYYISKISSLLKGKIIDIKKQNINFKKENYLFKKKDNKNIWGIIEYKEGSKPKTYSLIDFYDKLQKEDNSSFTKIGSVESYLSNKNYFNVSIDVNGDGKQDKIISSKPNAGDELLVYFSKNNTYTFQLKTTNFSQDGGNQISEIKKSNNGFVLVTSFPDKGFLECEYYIEYKENNWLLRNVIYKTKSSNQKNAFIYKCDVKQNLDLSDPNMINKINSIPDENKREKVCTKEFLNDGDKSTLVYIIKGSNGYSNLRKEKNNNSEIIQKIKKDEVINVLYSKGDWWLIETQEKKRGYIFKDEVEIKK